MRFLSSTLPIKEGLVYSYGRYRQDKQHLVKPANIANALHMTLDSVYKLLASLHHKQLVSINKEQLIFAEPTEEYFRFTKKGHPWYFPMSLNLIGSANES